MEEANLPVSPEVEIVDEAPALAIRVSAEALAAEPPMMPARLRNETESQWLRALHWLTAPERGERRSFAATAREFGVDPSVIQELASKRSWRSRGIELDRKRTERAALKLGELQASTAVSHVSLANDLIGQAQTALRMAEEMLLDSEGDVEALEAWQRLAVGISKILKEAQGAARRALCQADSHSSVHVKVEGPKDNDALDIKRCSLREKKILHACVVFQDALGERYQGADDAGPEGVEHALGALRRELDEAA